MNSSRHSRYSRRSLRSRSRCARVRRRAWSMRRFSRSARRQRATSATKRNAMARRRTSIAFTWHLCRRCGSSACASGKRSTHGQHDMRATVRDCVGRAQLRQKRGVASRHLHERACGGAMVEELDELGRRVTLRLLGIEVAAHGCPGRSVLASGLALAHFGELMEPNRFGLARRPGPVGIARALCRRRCALSQAGNDLVEKPIRRREGVR